MIDTTEIPTMARSQPAKPVKPPKKPTAKSSTRKPTAKSKGEPALVTALRDAIRTSGRSHNSIAKAAGVTSTNIDRFMAGADIRLGSAGRIASELGFALTKMVSANPQN